MNSITSLVMIAWIPIVLYLFYRYPASQAVIISFIVAWLFLPQKAGFSFPGLPDYERMSATVYGIILCTFIYDAGRFRQFQPSWLDLPMLVWCICPLFSSLSNDLGVYDGMSESLLQTMSYGGPYFLGKLYLSNLTRMRHLAIAIFVSGLAYVPLCLYEIRFSPQLHRLVYGYHPHIFAQSIRFEGFRPVVFMQHGLAVSMWMMAATLIGIYLWKTNAIDNIYGIHIRWLVGILAVTLFLSKSAGAYGLLILGVAILFFTWQFNSSILLFILTISIFFYLQQGVSLNSRLSEQILTTLDTVAPVERLESLEFRFDNEELLKNKAQEKKIFGWGGWGRSRVYDYNWQGEKIDISTTDSLWIITYGTNGLVGLVSLFSALIAPAIGFILTYSSEALFNKKIAPVFAIVVVLVLYTIDCLLNNMPNPIFILACGGLSGFVANDIRI